jgi:hypothetical protein
MGQKQGQFQKEAKGLLVVVVVRPSLNQRHIWTTYHIYTIGTQTDGFRIWNLHKQLGKHKPSCD